MFDLCGLRFVGFGFYGWFGFWVAGVVGFDFRIFVLGVWI